MSMADSDEETFVKFGNQLEPYDEDEVPRKKPVNIQDQYAVDERGRRRFHGAFTGGFSAGYFNTVGTRDGWTPQKFKSSRSNKAQASSQRPEDFMDEEDISEFGIAPTSVRPTDSFKDDTKKNLKRLRSRQFNDQPVPGTPVLQDFLVPARERVGIKLLKKMGWKPGQGIGPRVTKKEKQKLQKQQEILRKYGSSQTSSVEKPSASDSESSDDDYANITLAPSDFEVKKPKPQDNFFGIGYVGLNKEPVLSKHVSLFDEPTLHLRDKNKKLSIRGTAFGVGAFEVDDEDIYNRDDISQYDFSLGPEAKKSRWSQKERPKGLNCLEGFAPAIKPYQMSRTYDPPVLPKDFKPFHAFRQSRFFPPIEVTPSTSKSKPMLNAQSRARILSESGPAQNLIIRTLNLHGVEHAREQEKLEEKRKKDAASWLEKIKSSNFVRGGSLNTSEEMASSSTEMKAPFAYDSDKQKRFEEYSEFCKTGKQDKLSSLQPLSMNEQDRNQEKTEFEQALRLQTKAAAVEKKEEEPPLESLSPEERMRRAAKMKMFGKMTRRNEVWQPSSIVCKRFNVPEPSVGCAKPEMNKKKGFSVFGSMDWSNLTKFEKSTESESSAEPVRSIESVKFVEPVKPVEPVKSTESIKFVESLKSVEPLKSAKPLVLSVEKDENNEPETEKEQLFQVTYQKVFQTEEKSKKEENFVENLEEKRDLFKSIFLSSSEDSDSEGEAQENTNDEAVKTVLLGTNLKEINVQRNDSPPRGIFAKLDLDQMMTSKKKETTCAGKDKKELEQDNAKSADEVSNKSETSDSEPDMYGPVLPSTAKTAHCASTIENSQTPKHLFRSVAVRTTNNSSNEGKWVEKTNRKKSKKEKKKHKHKEKDKKKKSKKKKY